MPSTSSSSSIVTTYCSVYPPAYSTTYVKATSIAGVNYYQYLTFDPSKSLVGGSQNNMWLSNSPINQKLNVDLGSAKLITRIYYENGHHGGGNTDVGAKDYILYGTNSSIAFDNVIYSDTTDLVELSDGSFEQHVASDTVDPKYILVSNVTAYRYYIFRLTNNWGNGSYVGVRRITLQEDCENMSSDSSSSSSSLDSSSSSSSIGLSSSSSSSDRTLIYPNDIYDATERSDSLAFVSSDGDIATIVILGHNFIIKQLNDQLIWDFGGSNEYTFTDTDNITDTIIENRRYYIRYDGKGSLLFTLWYVDITHKTIPFIYEIEKTNPVWTMVVYGQDVYAGTGSEGILLKSRDRQIWSNIYQADDIHIKTLYIYNGKMYVGTAPKGKVYIMDLSTEEITLSQEIGNEISTFNFFNNNLYMAVSKPSQIYKYSFKDSRWDKFYKPYGEVITDMIIYDNKMYVFMDSENFIYFDGVKWVIENTGIDNISSVRVVSKEPFSHVSNNFIDRSTVLNTDNFEVEDLLDIFPLNRSKGIKSVTIDGQSLTIGSSVNGRIYNYAGVN